MSNLLLKKKLKALNYPTDFGDDSAPTIERLLTDLIKASEAYQMLKRENTKTGDLPKQSEKTLQNHIILLEKENNELHSRLIKIEETNSSMNVLIMKLEAENKELSTLNKFLQTGGKKNENGKAQPDQSTNDQFMFQPNADVTITKSFAKNLESKIEILEKTNISLKNEVSRLRSMYEGTLNMDSIQQQGQHVLKEQQKAKEEAFLSQMDYLTKKNEEMTLQLNSYKNSHLPQLSKELAEYKSLFKEERERTKNLEHLLEMSKAKENNLQQKVDEQMDVISQNANASYHQRISKELQENVKRLNTDIFEKDKKVLAGLKKIEELEIEKKNMLEQNLKIQEEFKNDFISRENESVKIQEMALKLSEREFDVQSLNYRLETASNQLECRNDEIKINQTKIDELNAKCNELNSQIQQLDFELRRVKFDLEQSKRIIVQKAEVEQKLKEKITQIEFEFKNKESVNSKLMQEEFLKRTQFDKALLIESELSLKEKEIERLLNENGFKEQKIITFEQNIFFLENELNSKKSLCESFEKEIELYLKEVQEAKNGLHQKAILEKELENVKKQLESYIFRVDKMEKIERESKNVKLESDYQKTKLTQKTKIIDGLETQIAIFQTNIEKLEFDSMNHIEQIRHKDILISNLNEEVKELTSLVHNKDDIILNFENKTKMTKTQIQTTLYDVNEHKKAIIEKDIQKKTLENEIEKLKIKNKELLQENELFIADLSNQTEKEGKINKNYQQILHEIEAQKDKNTFLQNSLEQINNKLKTKQNECDRINEENCKLNLLVNSFSSQKQELLLQETNQKTRQNNSSILENNEILNIENQKLKNQIQAFTESENLLKNKLLTIDSAKDEIQEICDHKTLENESLSNKIDKLSKNLKIITDEKEKIEQIAHELNFRVNSLESELNHKSDEFRTAKDELKSIREKLSKQEREKSDLTSDFQILAMENRGVVNDAMMMSKKVENLEKRLESKNEELKKKEYQMSSFNLENNQLKNNCKLFEQENYSLKKMLEKSQQTTENLSRRVKVLEQEIDNLHFEVQSLEKSKEALGYEVSSIQNNYNKALIELQSKDMNKMDNEQELRILRQKVENTENLAAKLNKELGKKEKDMNSLISDYNSLKQNFLLIKSKNDELVSKFAVEMKKNAELENAIMDERARNASLLNSIGKNRS